MSTITTKFSPGDTAYVVSDSGKIVSLDISVVRVEFRLPASEAYIIYTPRATSTLGSRKTYTEADLYTLEEARVKAAEVVNGIITDNAGI